MAKNSALTLDTVNELRKKYPLLKTASFLRFIVLKSRSKYFLDILARLSSGDQAATAEEYVKTFATTTSDFYAASTFAMVHGMNYRTEEARAEALAIFDFIAENSNLKLKMTPLKYYSYLLMHFGQSDRAKNLWKNQSKFRINTLLFDIATSYETEPNEWFAKFQKIFGKMGRYLEPIKPGQDAFRKLAGSKDVVPVTGESLVSVIMTTYKPDADAEHAINSILGQSYQNFELIIVDDGSGPEYREVLERLQKKDDRIRLIVLEKNVGTYGARNAGWLHANGRYLTGQDSDDWSHPLRLELQVKNLDENLHLAGNWCQGVRVSEHLQIDIRDGNAPLRRGQNSVAVSMMTRMSPTFLRLGFFDGARKAADSEYMQRMKRAFGNAAFAEIPETLYIIQARYDSLSRTDFTPGWRHPNRLIYASMYTRWHSTLDEATNPDFFMALDGDRKFPAPFPFTPEGKRGGAREFDLVVVGDFFWPSNDQKLLLKNIDEAVAEGKKVAFVQTTGPFPTSSRVGKLNEHLFSLYENWTVDFVALDDQNVSVSEVLSTTEFMAFGELVASNLKVETVRLAAPADRTKGLDEIATENSKLIFPNAKVLFEES